jgi:hypothetical protein
VNEREARLLRALARELSVTIAPKIESASGKELLRFAQHLRNSTFSAGSAREFHDGRADDFAQGAFGYFVKPRLEVLLAPLLEQAWTLETEPT